MMNKLDWMRQQHYELAEPCPEWWSFIHHHRLDPKTLEPHCGIFGVALCNSYEATNGARVFEFSPDGIPCGVIEAIAFRREHGGINPYTADLVAWPLHAPDLFATALGSGKGCELLGAWSACRTDKSPLRVHQTPMAWLKAGCEGCVVLKPGAEYWLKRAGGPFICDDAEHAHEVWHMLGDKAHDVLIPQIRRAA